ncbi:MAG: hypothetical protein IPM23_06255 [Candidatus Melainabacteria bacterium]|nr:hypothetical protein [Candidatus Melainabacteria bacterium]
MSTTTRIRAFIEGLDKDSIFTTRDLLSFGTRSAVDNAICKLVKVEEIVRIMPGIFSLPGSQRQVSLKELAIIKAESFGHQISEHTFDLTSEIPDNEVWFATTGSNSSFKFGSITIKFKPTSRRKIAHALAGLDTNRTCGFARSEPPILPNEKIHP